MITIPATGETFAMPVFTVTFPACTPVTVAAPDPDTAHAMAQTIAPTTAAGLVRDESGRTA